MSASTSSSLLTSRIRVLGSFYPVPAPAWRPTAFTVINGPAPALPHSTILRILLSCATRKGRCAKTKRVGQLAAKEVIARRALFTSPPKALGTFVPFLEFLQQILELGFVPGDATSSSSSSSSSSDAAITTTNGNGGGGGLLRGMMVSRNLLACRPA